MSSFNKLIFERNNIFIKMQITNQIVIDFFNNDQIIDEMLRNLEVVESDNESDYDSDYDTDNESDNESDYDSDYDTDNESDNSEELENKTENDGSSYNSDSDTDVIDEDLFTLPPPFLRREIPEDYSRSILSHDIEYGDLVTFSPPSLLRREVPEDYISPNRLPSLVSQNAPRADRRVLRDITNIVPRRLEFN